MSSTVPDDQERYKRARRRVREIRAFYIHLAVFVAVNLLLHLINFVTPPESIGHSGRCSAGASVSWCTAL